MLIRALNFTQNDLSATSDKNTNFNISKNVLHSVGISNSLCSRTVEIKQEAHIHQTHDPPSLRMSWENCRWCMGAPCFNLLVTRDPSSPRMSL